jgi:hypothetical protein
MNVRSAWIGLVITRSVIGDHRRSGAGEAKRVAALDRPPEGALIFASHVGLIAKRPLLKGSAGR